MKKIIVALTLFSAIASCKKDTTENKPTPTPTEDPILGKWKITGYIDADGENYYNIDMPTCEKDNIITYSKGNIVSIDEGPTKCYPEDEQVVSDGYVFNPDKTQITTYAGNEGDDLDKFDVISLSQTTMVLGEPGEPKSRITYTKQP